MRTFIAGGGLQIKDQGPVAAFEEAIAAGALLLLALSTVTGAVLVIAPPTAAQFAAADPLLRWTEASIAPALAVLASSLAAAGWLFAGFKRRHALSHLSAALIGFIGGAATAIAGTLLIRLIVGPALPEFIPSEESAAPGLALGLSAGLLEEAIFRFTLLAVFYLLARRWMPPLPAAALGIAIASFAFAIAHEAAESAALGGHVFNTAHFLTRLIFPGCVMSCLFFRPGPSFILALHWSAHVAIPLLFVSAGAAAR